VLNGLKIVDKDIGKVKLVCSGAGAAAIACLDLQVSLGLDPANIYVLDSKGVISKSRTNLDADKARYAQNTQAKALDDVIADATCSWPLGTGRADAGHGQAHGRPADHPRDGESRSPRSVPSSRRPRGPIASSAPAAPTIPTR
jgi:malate dehydrogenase (oxaloacetate-decarboxylating)(NADP+)